MLDKFRRGHCDEASVQLLAKCGSNLSQLKSIKVRPLSLPLPSLTIIRQPPNLYPLEHSVETENLAEFKKLSDKAYTFFARDTAQGPRAKLLQKDRIRPLHPSSCTALLIFDRR